MKNGNAREIQSSSSDTCDHQFLSHYPVCFSLVDLLMFLNLNKTYEEFLISSEKRQQTKRLNHASGLNIQLTSSVEKRIKENSI